MNPLTVSPKNHRLASLKSEKTHPQVIDSVSSLSINCKYCGHRCIKNGVEKNGKQRFKCKECKKSQQLDYVYQAYDSNLNQNIIALTKEGVGIRGTARLLGISPTTLISRIKKIASEIKEPPLVNGNTYEEDELRTFVKKKGD